MAEFDANTFELIAKILGGAGGLILFFRGYQEYRRSNKIKRAEFLEKLIADFHADGHRIAINLLDDYVYVKTEDRSLSPAEQMSKSVSLQVLLRDHRKEPITEIEAIAVRRSFDQTLDFFTRLSYYLQNNLITPKELIYFRYYIERIRDKKEVRNYISYYFYPGDFDELFDAVQRLK